LTLWCMFFSLKFLMEQIASSLLGIHRLRA
jgi:hypothetical protein